MNEVQLRLNQPVAHAKVAVQSLAPVRKQLVGTRLTTWPEPHYRFKSQTYKPLEVRTAQTHAQSTSRTSFLNEPLEPWMPAQVVQLGVHLQVGHMGGALVAGDLQPPQGFFVLSESKENQSLEIG